MSNLIQFRLTDEEVAALKKLSLEEESVNLVARRIIQDHIKNIGLVSYTGVYTNQYTKESSEDVELKVDEKISSLAERISTIEKLIPKLIKLEEIANKLGQPGYKEKSARTLVRELKNLVND